MTIVVIQPVVDMTMDGQTCARVTKVTWSTQCRLYGAWECGTEGGEKGGGRNDADYTESQQMIQLLLQLGHRRTPSPDRQQSKGDYQ